MPSPLEVHDWHELDVYAQDGEHVGKLADVYVSKETGEPEFLLVSSGFLGHSLHMVPADSPSTPGWRRMRRRRLLRPRQRVSTS